MYDYETVYEYYYRLFRIVIKVWILGNELPDSRVIVKLLVTLHEKFEPTIDS